MKKGSEVAVRDQIVSTAWNLFTRYGYSGTTMAEIARELATSKRTIYEYYADKETLLRASVSKALNESDRQIMATISNETTPRRRLRAMVQAATEQLRATDSLLLHDMQRHAPDVWQDVVEEREKLVRKHLAQALDLPDKVPSTLQEKRHRIAHVIAAGVSGILHQRESTGETLEVAEDIELFISILEAAFFGRYETREELTSGS